MCSQIPFCLGTDCKSLYDTTMKPSSTTKEKRVALDLLDVREGVERHGDQIRWVPTDHMLVDSLTKAMNPALLMKYLHDYTYSLKYDSQITETKRYAAKQRKEAREQKRASKKPSSSKPSSEPEASSHPVHHVVSCTSSEPIERHFVGCVFVRECLPFWNRLQQHYND